MASVMGSDTLCVPSFVQSMRDLNRHGPPCPLPRPWAAAAYQFSAATAARLSLPRMQTTSFFGMPWLKRTAGALRRAPPVDYSHVVFTLPHALNALAQGNPKPIYDALCRAASETLLSFGRSPRWLGGEIGATRVAHTWGQNLGQHLHVHCVVTGGALSSDASRFIPAKQDFLFPVRALSRVFRGKYLEALQQAHGRGELCLAGELAGLAEPQGFARLLAELRSQEVMALPAPEFIRRFLLHVLPPGFMRIRHVGLLANRHRTERLGRCRAALGQPQPEPQEPESVEAAMLRLTGLDIQRCPYCGEGRLRRVVLVAPIRATAPTPRATGPPRLS
jgi:hypothetical protein